MEKNLINIGLIGTTSDPSDSAKIVNVYAKIVSELPEAFLKTGHEVIQLTSDGALLGNFHAGFGIASQNNISLPAIGNVFNITGTTQINTIAFGNRKRGATIILLFSTSITIAHNSTGSGTPIILSGAVNFSATANASLMLTYDGTFWREISRTVI